MCRKMSDKKWNINMASNLLLRDNQRSLLLLREIKDKWSFNCALVIHLHLKTPNCSVKKLLLSSKVKMSLCLLKYHSVKTSKSGGIPPCILSLGTRGIFVVSFTT
jgi:hypothetical protein